MHQRCKPTLTCDDDLCRYQFTGRKIDLNSGEASRRKKSNGGVSENGDAENAKVWNWKGGIPSLTDQGVYRKVTRDFFLNIVLM